MPGDFDNETGGHGGDLLDAAKRWKPESGKMIDFSSNINPFGPPPGLLEFLRRSLPEIVSYPSPQARELREKLGLFLNLPLECLLIGNGANELIHLLLLWRRPGKVFVPAPSFSEYERAAVLAGARVEHYFLPPGEEIDFSSLACKLDQGDLMVFCNPNNPTGMLSTRSDLTNLVDAAAERGATVLIDESFIPLTGKLEESLRDQRCGNLWVVTSLTKIWSLPGLRLGFAIGPQEDVKEITRWGDPWRVNTLAQKAGIFCLGRKSYLKKSLALIEKERRFLTGRFRETGAFYVYEGSANYLLLRGLNPAFNVAEYQDYLAKRGILIRRADNFCSLDQRYFRIAVLKRPENLRLLQYTDDYIKGGTSCLNFADKGGKLP
ncbi:MAG: pyridoxal phosphate-dependent aminotransferase [Bacillota bacterium]